MKRVDSWEAIAAVAMHCAKKKTVRGASYAISAYSVASACDRLARLARTLKRYDEANCNGEVSDATLDKVRARYRKTLARISTELGVTVEHQTDPRGATIKVWADKVEGRLLACF